MIDRKQKYKRHAFTLVEIMIVCICIGLLVSPIFVLLRSGSDSSLKGMMRIDTTLKARTILHQVYADLKMACLPLAFDETNSGIKYDFSQVLTTKGAAPKVQYEFVSFPIHQKYSDIFYETTNNKGQEMNYRKVCKITYTVKGNNKSPFKKLIREVEFDNKKQTHVLSENVNQFYIEPVTDLKINGRVQYYYLITLQLVDVMHVNEKENVSYDDIKGDTKNLILADFYDVVYPEQFNSIWNNIKPVSNWHTVIKDSNKL